jgi:hypothetical protein
MLYRIIPFILHSRPSLGARRPALPPYADGPGWRTCMQTAIKTDLPESIWPPNAGPASPNDPGGSLAVAAGSHGGPGGGMDWIERVLECTIEKIGRSPDTKIKPTAGGTMGGKEGQRIPQPRYQKRYTQDTKKRYTLGRELSPYSMHSHYVRSSRYALWLSDLVFLCVYVKLVI